MRMVINDTKNNAMGVNLHETFFLAFTCWLDQARLHNQNFPKRTQKFYSIMNLKSSEWRNEIIFIYFPYFQTQMLFYLYI